MNSKAVNRLAAENLVFWGSGTNAFAGIINKSVIVPEGERGLHFMREFLRKNYRKRRAGEPLFTAGFVGFLSYDLGAKWQGIRQKVKRDTICPSAHFVYIDNVVAIRRGDFGIPLAGTGCRLALARRSLPLGFAIANGEACESPARDIHKTPAPASDLTYKSYLGKIRTIKKYLFSGDTYQVNFSQRFELPYSGEAIELYKKITSINPSPFQFFLQTSRFAVISNSPERLFKIVSEERRAGSDLIIETRPIKGTAPRGKSRIEDAKNIKKLLSSEKECAELSMIVDLERNDLGKICRPGTVEVNKHRTIEKYSHVIHTVSNIKGELRSGCDWLDALHALFPGGSVTGCPKKRTMEIIDKLEGFGRGIYCGSAGYVDLSGDCDFNIMIRTLWLEKGKNEAPARLIFHSGGGIVVDSDAKREYEETLHKAAAIVSAL